MIYRVVQLDGVMMAFKMLIGALVAVVSVFRKTLLHLPVKLWVKAEFGVWYSVS